MKALTEYFKNITETVVTIFEGMSITFSHFLRKPTTIQYPDRIEKPVQETLPLRYRGHLEVDIDICTDCKACERVCPITCIYIGNEKGPDGKKLISEFLIDIDKCMYCGLCAEVCPTGSIRHSQEFEGATYNPASFLRRFVLEGKPVPPFKPKQDSEKFAEQVNIGKKYMDEFASPDDKK